YPLKTEKDKKTTLGQLVSKIKTSDRFVDLNDILHFLQDKLENGHTTHIQDALLNFDDIRKMQKNGITFASHTLNHPILTRIPHHQMTKEISESKQILEKELNQCIGYLAYPNGGRDDYDNSVIEQLRQAGYQGACTLIAGINVHPNPFELKRYGIDREFGTGRFARHIFAAEISGLFNVLLLRHLRAQAMRVGLKKAVFSQRGIKK
ncbi:polysaccharide deacetylase family protein, partial [candidate division KSB1 bacterium]|nr:polysaccharide deacetylase family protein [candidate division KSB1 bacterium]